MVVRQFCLFRNLTSLCRVFNSANIELSRHSIPPPPLPPPPRRPPPPGRASVPRTRHFPHFIGRHICRCSSATRSGFRSRPGGASSRPSGCAGILTTWLDSDSDFDFDGRFSRLCQPLAVPHAMCRALLSDHAPSSGRAGTRVLWQTRAGAPSWSLSRGGDRSVRSF